ncbi:hypothetical protein [Rhodopirellula halodulae]|uniref:hypothetical protein n=1 Tax=Rhodopirellula halodulae TaxID=2894198 RepID=UPI001E3B685E|nr:hypothetical protein [Rhodopirellula sp. JC740]
MPMTTTTTGSSAPPVTVIPPRRSRDANISAQESSVTSAASRSFQSDRRRNRESSDGFARERRQFGSSHADLSEDGRELAAAIDQYKMQHHRRYITCDEMLLVMRQLGYSK